MNLSISRVLFIGLVWPEPSSSAAGTRIIQLIHFFQECGAQVFFASAANKAEHSHPLVEIGVEEISIQLNNAEFDTQISQIDPEVVVYDRFMIEEQFGWRVRQNCPNAYTILDTEDLHFLRYARQKAVKTNTEPDLHTDSAMREIASILRSDLSLIISKHEMTLLEKEFRIAPALLYYLPFLEAEIDKKNLTRYPSFSERKNFMFIGNFMHEPNWHTVKVLKKDIWPILRKKLPEAELHIYGAYMTEKVSQLQNTAEKFRIMGRADDARATISNYRLLLAPIPFGAGCKGKLIDAMATGTPSISSQIGAEGMQGALEWNGAVTLGLEDFCTQAYNYYTDAESWNIAQNNGIKILKETFSKDVHSKFFAERLNKAIPRLTTSRKENFIGQILHHNAHNSLKYMSLWIEEKNKKN